MSTNYVLFAHALIVLPDNRVLLRKQHYSNTNFNRWSATIEKVISKTDVPRHKISEAVLDELGLDLSIMQTVPKTTIRTLTTIVLPEYNRIICPFVIKIDELITLKSETKYQFIAKAPEKIAEDIMYNTVYKSTAETIRHTINTINVMQEVQF